MIAGVTIAVFVIVRLNGDPAAVMLPPDASAADLAAFRHAHGYDRSLGAQFVAFVASALHGDFGTSIRYHEPAVDVALKRVPASVELAFAALLLACAVGIPAGVLSAVRRGTMLDYAARLGALIGQSTPVYWLGLMLIFGFGVRLGWLPAGGRGGISHLLLPALTLSAFSMARLMRLTRSSVLDVLGRDFLTAAAAKGLGPARLIMHHVLRNAALPIVVLLGLDLGMLFSQAVVAETIFAWPGVGRLAITAIFDRDYAVVQVVVLLSALAFIVVNALADVVCALLDPRIRYE